MPLIAKKARENQKGGQGGVLLHQKSDKANGNPPRTIKEIAKIAGVSHDTIQGAQNEARQTVNRGDCGTRITESARLATAVGSVDGFRPAMRTRTSETRVQSEAVDANRPRARRPAQCVDARRFPCGHKGAVVPGMSEAVCSFSRGSVAARFASGAKGLTALLVFTDSKKKEKRSE